MLDSERTADNYSLVTEDDKYVVAPMEMSVNRLMELWEQMSQYRTLFSDTTIGDIDNYVKLVTLPNSLWYDVVRKDTNKTVGVLYITDIQPLFDMTVHVMFFDRVFADKGQICVEHLRKVFALTKTHRASAVIPDIYHATIRFAERIGFKREGVKRESVSIGGKWRDEIFFGIFRTEV